MFADTLTITINGAAKVLTRVNQDGYSSEYRLRAAGESFSLKLRNTSFKDKSRGGVSVDRHAMELVHTVEPVAPATVATIRKTYAVIENDISDGLVSPAKHAVGALAFLTEANITKLLGWES